ncbi:O-fucosyltransferase family protein [Quillaja saponaria]|uniref:O-fucosyltransferase family protein n=1 Tax=Quillaja saponaria TaxID=32244 RepID=A0AAD7PE31_QUISA|nr:O-fucosyltransferase family protein [Quillaja saponaria]
MKRDSSSDEEDDHQNLIEQNETKQPTPRSTTFQIDDFSSRVNARFNFKSIFNKRYLFAIFLPLFIVLLYCTTDVRNLFATNFSPLKLDWVSDQMKESELRALYLLRQQQLGLLGIWNRTYNDNFPPIQSNSTLNATSSKLNKSSPVENEDLENLLQSSSLTLLEDVKAAVLKQISLNKEIQQVLLSPHRTGNLSESGFDIGNASLGGFGYDRCRKVDQNLSQRRTIEWKPKPNKFLFAICLSGQMSNHLICLEKHMFFAAVLGRVLVIPSSKMDYQYNRVLDIDRINKCFGRKVVIPFEEFSEIKKNHMHINKFICYFSLPQPCYVDGEHIKKLKSLGLSMSKPEPAWVEDIKKPNKRTIQDVQSKFSFDDEVIAIGDVFYADFEQQWVMQPGGPLAHKCKTLIEPSHLIMLTAQRFIQTFLGKNFIALHFRRHGFLKFCNVKTPSCFYPIPQAADCILRLVERANTPVIYLSTDAAKNGMLFYTGMALRKTIRWKPCWTRLSVPCLACSLGPLVPLLQRISCG